VAAEGDLDGDGDSDGEVQAAGRTTGSKEPRARGALQGGRSHAARLPQLAVVESQGALGTGGPEGWWRCGGALAAMEMGRGARRSVSKTLAGAAGASGKHLGSLTALGGRRERSTLVPDPAARGYIPRTICRGG